MTTATRKLRAELRFVQLPDRYVEGFLLMAWRGILPAGAIDSVSGKPAVDDHAGRRYVCRLEQQLDGSVRLTTQGANKGGRRHSTFRKTDEYDRHVGVERAPIADAQRAALGWARRRFWVER